MYRLIGFILVLASAAAAVAAGLRLEQALSQPVASVQADDVVSPGDAVLSMDEEPGPRPFLAIFGTEPEPIPSAPVAAAEPDEPEFDHTLKGVIASGDMRWAILEGPSGDMLVREGDQIDGGEIAHIHAEGVEVDIGGEVLTLTFSASERVEFAEIEAPDLDDEEDVLADNQPRPQKPERRQVIFQGMSPDDLRKVLREAEQNRKDRGWVDTSR